MVFIAYILFLTYWALEGYSAAICEHFMKDTRYIRKIKHVSYIMRSLFVLFAFALLYFYTKDLLISISLIVTFLLGVPNFYYGVKYTRLTKMNRAGYYLGWFDSMFEDHKIKIRNSRARVFMLALSCALIIAITITKIYYL